MSLNILQQAKALAGSRSFLVGEDVDLIASIVGAFSEDRPIRVVDLGAGAGTAALSVFAGRDRNLVVYGIDRDSNALNWATAAVVNVGMRGYYDPHHVEDGEAENALAIELFKGGEIEVLLVDADHSYEGVRASVARWLPLVAPGGSVWFHDYVSARGWPGFSAEAEEYPGVALAVDEFVESGLVGVVQARGLGIHTTKAHCANCGGRGFTSPDTACSCALGLLVAPGDVAPRPDGREGENPPAKKPAKPRKKAPAKKPATPRPRRAR